MGMLFKKTKTKPWVVYVWALFAAVTIAIAIIRPNLGNLTAAVIMVLGVIAALIRLRIDSRT